MYALFGSNLDRALELKRWKGDRSSFKNVFLPFSFLLYGVGCCKAYLKALPFSPPPFRAWGQNGKALLLWKGLNWIAWRLVESRAPGMSNQSRTLQLCHRSTSSRIIQPSNHLIFICRTFLRQWVPPDLLPRRGSSAFECQLRHRLRRSQLGQIHPAEASDPWLTCADTCWHQVIRCLSDQRGSIGNKHKSGA